MGRRSSAEKRSSRSRRRRSAGRTSARTGRQPQTQILPLVLTVLVFGNFGESAVLAAFSSRTTTEENGSPYHARFQSRAEVDGETMDEHTIHTMGVTLFVFRGSLVDLSYRF